MPRYKYGPLRRYLAEETRDRVTLTLAEVSAIIGAPLPNHARMASFWSNSAGADGPAWAWRSVGWRVVERRYQYPMWVITFARDDARPAGPP